MRLTTRWLSPPLCSPPTGPAAIAKTRSPEAAPSAPVPGMVSSADPRAVRGRRGDAAQGRKRGRRGVRDPARAQRRRAGKPGHRRRLYLVYSPRGATPVTFDGRETAPRAATGTWFYKNGQPIEHEDAIPGGKSVGVPGNLRLMAMAHAALRQAALGGLVPAGDQARARRVPDHAAALRLADRRLAGQAHCRPEGRAIVLPARRQSRSRSALWSGIRRSPPSSKALPRAVRRASTPARTRGTSSPPSTARRSILRG